MLFKCRIHYYTHSFVGVVILNWVDPALLLSFFAFMCSLSALCVASLDGWTGVGFLYVLFFFELICYPVSPAFNGIVIYAKLLWLA